ncbi:MULTISPECIES: conjugative transposon protein TraM [unclassified Algoriphagus]|jgi:conjugative transposon TraM protein|uniref:conjugative transposon protein TraM n=2 Tax=Algoriphagus TaxID=246875 RepID=UPI000C3758A0|nr:MULTISPECIES: conjugative transposon protein TraM [unclassified Algoriphagus]MAL13704.1 conjugative transposon protein TraM [Algoriphagus sp.]MAN86026.1 conjugative transposon protein TraM [Algoriphagus sp.]HAD50736.1 conjugative transposon protein TraM [Algoriphagus sp.]HAH37076.1 conjugative transposon protein TraM [Algoriphagus sp.]HAS58680.1 conjugative transposon protein TraM [Algoriphagus sp.]|tara:strand:- start:8 stop:1231 length:1224 start_codon:yes stop_codon:yes gene_type:complete
MKIDFKQPKYILPIIMLPFLCLLFYGYKSFSKDSSDEPVQGLSGIQSEIGKVSEQIQKKPLDSKLDASRETYKRANDGYTAIKGLELEVEESSQIKTLYNEEEKRLLDSIDNALKGAGLYSGKPDVPNVFPSVIPTPSRQQSFSKEDEELLNAINQLEGKKTQVPANRYEDPMDLFKAQMAVIDSISKANDPAYQELQQKEKESQPVANETENVVYRVQKSEGAATLFNTVTREKKGKFIEAIIDQDIKSGTLGARLRIRLLDDILIGNAIVGRGTYLYALISGYEAQRVKLTISSVMINDRIFPIKLSIYDVDGMEGLYVPASAFREFSKELGGNTTGGMNLTMQQNSDALSQLYMSALQRMFTSTSQAVSKSIKKNKANIKYGTSVYLIDTNELQENGKMIQNQN